MGELKPGWECTDIVHPYGCGCAADKLRRAQDNDHGGRDSANSQGGEVARPGSDAEAPGAVKAVNPDSLPSLPPAPDSAVDCDNTKGVDLTKPVSIFQTDTKDRERVEALAERLRAIDVETAWDRTADDAVDLAGDMLILLRELTERRQEAEQAVAEVYQGGDLRWLDTEAGQQAAAKLKDGTRLFTAWKYIIDLPRAPVAERAPIDGYDAAYLLAAYPDIPGGIKTKLEAMCKPSKN